MFFRQHFGKVVVGMNIRKARMLIGAFPKKTDTAVEIVKNGLNFAVKKVVGGYQPEISTRSHSRLFLFRYAPGFVECRVSLYE